MGFDINQKHQKKKTNRTSSDLMDKIYDWFLFFLKKLLLCNISYIELFTRKI